MTVQPHREQVWVRKNTAYAHDHIILAVSNGQVVTASRGGYSVLSNAGLNIYPEDWFLDNFEFKD